MRQTNSPHTLGVHNLSVVYERNGVVNTAVWDFSIAIEPGQIYGLVGETGSGKSTVAAAIMGFLPPNGFIKSGRRIDFAGQDITHFTRQQMTKLWATDLNLVPQHPGSALNPSMRIGDQLAEVARRSMGLSDQDVRTRITQMFQRVQLPNAESIGRKYPHELSGGQQQRAIIAMALLTSPRLLILDEPTTNLDVTTEAIILALVEDLIREEKASALYVTHNLGTVAQICDRVTVLYAGEIMEDASVSDLFSQPLHPYTIGLLRSILEPGQTKRDRALESIPGHPATLSDRPPGCVFAPRCPLAIELCSQKPPLEETAPDRRIRCHRWAEIAAGEIIPLYDTGAAILTGLPAHDSWEAILEASEFTKYFHGRRTAGDLLRGRRSLEIQAVDHVNIRIRKGRTYGLIGESGSGKTTLARMIVGLTAPDDGHMTLMGIDVPTMVRDRSLAVCAQLQMIFQNPQSSLNPYRTVRQTIRRPLIKLAGMSRAAADHEVDRLLESVHLRAEYASRFPGELSGGELQRVAIARALASNPGLILCDEPISSLDVSVQSALLNLLARLQEERGISYLFISHDLAAVAYLADYVAVMYLGELFEVGYARDLFAPPLHPYTEALISSIPIADPKRRGTQVLLTGDILDASKKPAGCVFHTRCPRKLGILCETQPPPWHDDDDEHYVRCHIPLDELISLQSYLPNKISG